MTDPFTFVPVPCPVCGRRNEVLWGLVTETGCRFTLTCEGCGTQIRYPSPVPQLTFSSEVEE